MSRSWTGADWTDADPSGGHVLYPDARRPLRDDRGRPPRDEALAPVEEAALLRAIERCVHRDCGSCGRSWCDLARERVDAHRCRDCLRAREPWGTPP